MNYDDWKLMTPEEANGTAYDEYVPVKVEVLIFDPGQNVIDSFRDDSKINFEDGHTTLTTIITVDALLTCDDFEKESWVRDEDVENAVAKYLGNDSDYEILEWWTA